MPSNPEPSLSMSEGTDCAAASDERLARRAGRGCASSFDELCRRYQVPLLELFRFRGHAADSEDLLQETLVRAYKNLHRYDQRWRFATWLFVIARRASINHHQRFRVPANSEALQSVPSPARQPDQIAADDENRKRLWELARRVLTEEEVTALWLHYVEDMPVRQIAVVLGRSWVGVKTMMFRARKKLRPCLRQPDTASASDETAEPSKKS